MMIAPTMKKKPAYRITVRFVSRIIVVLVFCLSQNLHAARSKSSFSSRCSEPGKILAASLDGEAHRTDVLLSSPPEFPDVAVADPIEISKLVRLTVGSDVWERGWMGDRPSADLVRRWFGAPYISISKCFGQTKSQRKIGDLPGFTNFRPIPEHAIGPLVIRATAPVLDQSGTYALVFYATSTRTAFGGREAFILLKRNGSGWRQVGSRVLAVS